MLVENLNISDISSLGKSGPRPKAFRGRGSERGKKDIFSTMKKQNSVRRSALQCEEEEIRCFFTSTSQAVDPDIFVYINKEHVDLETGLWKH